MLDLSVLDGDYAICRLPEGSPLPRGFGARPGAVVSVAWTPGETSLLCPYEMVPEGVVSDGTQWRCLRAGPVSLTQTGIMASLSRPLAEARVNIFAFSTHDSDYLLVPAVRLDEAVAALRGAGHRISGTDHA